MALTIVGPASPTSSAEISWSPSMPIGSGASVKRLQALIAQRRRGTPPAQHGLGVVPEMPGSPTAFMLPTGGYASSSYASSAYATKALAPDFDPFFDDPFAT